MPERGRLLGTDRLSGGGRRPARMLNVRTCAAGRICGIFGVDVGAAFPIVALGKPAPMPYVWHPRRETERQWTFGAPAVPAKMVEVPNPLKFLG